MSPEAIRRLITLPIALGFAFWITRQVRKPTWYLGRFVAWTMNKSHALMTNWGLTHVTVEPGAMVLDVGCGGGRTVAKLAELASRGKVYGVDYSAASVAQSTSTNRDLIAAGRVEIREASVSSLPFGDNTFDVVTAVETHYYWPDLTKDLGEVRRVLKPGGHVALIAETFRGDGFGLIYQPAMRLIGARYLTKGQHEEALGAAGFVEVKVDTHPGHGWITVTGKKA